MLKVLRLVVATAIGVVALIAAVRLVALADNPSSVRRQLAFLRSALSDGAAVGWAGCGSISIRPPG